MVWMTEDRFKGLETFSSEDLTGIAKIFFTSEDRAILEQKVADGVIPDMVASYVTEDYVNIDLVIEGVAQDYTDVSRIEEHIGDTMSTYFYGRKPLVLVVQATLFNDSSNYNKAGLAGLYRHVMRLTAVARHRIVPNIAFVGSVAKGAFLNLAFSSTSDKQGMLGVQFHFLVFEYTLVNNENDTPRGYREVSMIYNLPAQADEMLMKRGPVPPDMYIEPQPDSGDPDTPPNSLGGSFSNPPGVDLKELYKQLKAHEGERLSTYYCTAGKLTIGIGHNLDAMQTSPIIGRNLNKGDSITKDESDKIFNYDITKVIKELNMRAKVVQTLSMPRQHVLIDMAFNMGVPSLMGFVNMWNAIITKKWDTAAQEILNSKYAKDVGSTRSGRLARMMRTDTLFSQLVA